MLHKYLSRVDGDPSHYAVGIAANNKYVLVQLSDAAGDQVRVALTKEEAKDFARSIFRKIQEMEEHNNNIGGLG